MSLNDLGASKNGICKRYLHTNVCNNDDCKFIHDKSIALLCK